MSDKAGGLFYPKTESSQPHEQELGSAFLQGSFQNDQAEMGQFTGMVLVPPLVMLSLVVCVSDSVKSRCFLDCCFGRRMTILPGTHTGSKGCYMLSEAEIARLALCSFEHLSISTRIN